MSPRPYVEEWHSREWDQKSLKLERARMIQKTAPRLMGYPGMREREGRKK